MTAPMDIANLALDSIGARFSITSLNPPLPPPNAVVVARQYQLRIDALSRAANWNCLRRQAQLTLLKAAAGTPENANGTTLPIPPVPYQYEYAYPADCLDARYLIPSNPNSSQSALPIFGAGVSATPWYTEYTGYYFAVAIDTDAAGNQVKVILTDLEFAQCVYTARVDNPDLWDPHFQVGAVAALASWLVNPLARNAQVLKEQIEIARGVILEARISDGNEGMTTTDHVPDWMAVRGFSAMNYLNGPTCYNGWTGMGFPGGIFV